MCYDSADADAQPAAEAIVVATAAHAPLSMPTDTAAQLHADAAPQSTPSSSMPAAAGPAVEAAVRFAW